MRNNRVRVWEEGILILLYNEECNVQTLKSDIKSTHLLSHANTFKANDIIENNKAGDESRMSFKIK